MEDGMRSTHRPSTGTGTATAPSTSIMSAAEKAWREAGYAACGFPGVGPAG
jgi:hypothetical protein